MKKGMSMPMEFLIGLVLLLAAFFIVLTLLIEFGYISLADSDLQLCKASIIVQEKTQVGTGSTVLDSPLHLDCPVRTINVGDSRASIQKTGPDFPLAYYPPDPAHPGSALRRITYSKLNSTIINSLFAESMRRCWNEGLEGNDPVFNDQSIFHEKNVCLVCDQINLQAASIDLPASKKTGLYSYLQATNMPNIQAQETYGQYLFTPTNLQKGWATTVAQKYGSYSCVAATVMTEGLAAIPCLWIWAKDNTGPQTLSAGTVCLSVNNIDLDPAIEQGTYATVFFRRFSKTSDGCMNVYVVPENKLRSLCDYTAN